MSFTLFQRPERFALEPLLLLRWAVYAVGQVATQIILFMILMQAYKMVRKTFIQRAERVAFDNALDLLWLQGKLGLNIELDLQKFVLDHDWMIWFFNRYYTYFMTGFYICAASAILFAPKHYPFLRRTFFASMVLALPWYAIYPLAPPRFMDPYGYPFLDTLAVYGPNYFSDSGLVTANRYAAMPSMHCGWTLIGAVMLAYAYPKWRVGAIVGGTHTALMFLTVMVTGNHYVLDIVGGVLVAGAAFVVAYWFPTWRAWVLDRVGVRASDGPRTQTAPATSRAD
jgi:hypothetical protein